MTHICIKEYNFSFYTLITKWVLQYPMVQCSVVDQIGRGRKIFTADDPPPRFTPPPLRFT
jgi:hypothetical protein